MMFYELPTKIELDGQSFTIRNNGDFRVILDCFSILTDVDLDKKERVITCLVIFYGFDDIDDLSQLGDLEKAAYAMYEFMNLGEKSQGKTKQKLMDWGKDAQLIFSAINTNVGRDIRADEYLHWFTFIGYYMGIGESVFSTIVSIRSKIMSGKKLETYERKFVDENPHYFEWNNKTEQQIEDEKYIMELWNSKKVGE